TFHHRLTCYFPAMEGVCDTPLHLFAVNMDETVVGWWAAFAHFRAYAIRPYTCSVKTWMIRWWDGGLLSLTSGRMRYAPTLVR
ncbi:MAG: hypothetical protein SPK32_01495, partial [Bacteroidaceae bacterium]|nr:hypothetical protein [Bacteroidaceae bacterium]